MEKQIAITVEEMAKMLRISARTAYKIANSEGFYPAITIGKRKTIILLSELERWLLEQTQNKKEKV